MLFDIVFSLQQKEKCIKTLNIIALLVIYVSVQGADFKGVMKGLSLYQYIVFLVFPLDYFQVYTPSKLAIFLRGLVSEFANPPILMTSTKHALLL